MYNRIIDVFTKKLFIPSNIKSISTKTCSTVKISANADVQYEEISIPVPWGHIAGKWWGPKNRKPIFALHGWQDNCGSFDLLFQTLPRHLSILALDLPGHGYSSKLPPGIYYDNLMGTALIRHLQRYFNFEKIALIGHSLGAIISYTYAGLFPHTMEFLLCIDGLHLFVHDQPLQRVTRTIDAHLKYNEHYQMTLASTENPPIHNLETMEEMLHKGTRLCLDKDKCKYILDRNIRASPIFPGMFYFDRDPRLKAGPLMNWPIDVQLKHASRITFPILATKAEVPSPPTKNVRLYNALKKNILNVNENAEFHHVPGNHFGHLNHPEVFSDIITTFIEKHGNYQYIDENIFDSIKS